MQILINTDGNIEGNEKSAADVKGVVERALSRFSKQITRVEVHLRDERLVEDTPENHPREVWAAES